MRMSIQMRSGDSFLNTSTASLPFLASRTKKPTTFQQGFQQEQICLVVICDEDSPGFLGRGQADHPWFVVNGCLDTRRFGDFRRQSHPEKRPFAHFALYFDSAPPINSAYFLQMDSPRPVPLRTGSSIPCTKGSKICACLAGSIPEPVSSTSITMWQRFGSSAIGSVSHRMVTPPSSVNLTALFSRLIRIWRSFPESAFT